jgi:hypothetical protein
MAWITLRVYRVPGFLSSRPNWVPHKQANVAPPFWVQEGVTHSLAGEQELGGPNSRDSHAGIYYIIPQRVHRSKL